MKSSNIFHYLSSFILHNYYNIFFYKNQKRFFGGDSGTRTHTTSRPSDFESDTSTDSIISPCVRILIRVPRTLMLEKFAFQGVHPHSSITGPVIHFWLKPLTNKSPSILAPDNRAVRLSWRTTCESVSGSHITS